MPSAGQCSYRIREIKFFGSLRRVLMQSTNGPCPLLAACNVLLLRNQLPLPSGASSVDFPELLQILSNVLLDLNANGPVTHVDGKQMTDMQQSLESCIEVLPTLNVGLDVNCRFSNPQEFEYTRELCVFDLLDISIVHGWLVSPEDSRAFQVITKHSYNTLAEKLVEFKEIQQRIFDKNQDGATEQGDVTKILEEGAVIQEFFDKNASQLTYEGIIQLHGVLKDKQLAVFFRNHHFNVVLKHQHELYLLCTDVGFLGEDAVWERLDAVDGDTVYLDGNFQSLRARPSGAPTQHALPSVGGAAARGLGQLQAQCPSCKVTNSFPTSGAGSGEVNVQCGRCGAQFVASRTQQPLVEQTCRHCGTRNQFPAPIPGQPWPIMQCGKCNKTNQL